MVFKNKNYNALLYFLTEASFNHITVNFNYLSVNNNRSYFFALKTIKLCNHNFLSHVAT